MTRLFVCSASSHCIVTSTAILRQVFPAGQERLSGIPPRRSTRTTALQGTSTSSSNVGPPTRSETGSCRCCVRRARISCFDVLQDMKSVGHYGAPAISAGTSVLRGESPILRAGNAWYSSRTADRL